MLHFIFRWSPSVTTQITKSYLQWAPPDGKKSQHSGFLLRKNKTKDQHQILVFMVILTIVQFGLFLDCIFISFCNDYFFPSLNYLKLVPAIFIKFYFFTKWQLFKNCEKCFLFHLKSSFRSRDIQFFVFLSLPLFLPVNHCFRGWSKINL